jgi:hypothetical protein
MAELTSIAVDQFKAGRPRAARPRSAPIVRTTSSILQKGSCIAVLPNVRCMKGAANRCTLSSLFATYVVFASSAGGVPQMSFHLGVHLLRQIVRWRKGAGRLGN